MDKRWRPYFKHTSRASIEPKSWSFGLLLWWWNTHLVLRVHIGRSYFLIGFRDEAFFEEQEKEWERND